MATTKVTSSVLADDAVATATIADDAVTTAKIADNAVTNALMADDAVGVAELSATGSPSASTFLRGDNAWAAPAVLPAATFTSSEQTVAVDTVLDVPHGLGAIPSLVQVRLRCKTADVGYSVGDEIVVSSGPVDLVDDSGWTVQTDATNVTILQGISIPVINQGSLNASSITVGSWRWIVKAWA